MSELSPHSMEPVLDCGTFVVTIESPEELRESILHEWKDVTLAVESFQDEDDVLYESRIGLEFDPDERRHTVSGFVTLSDCDLIISDPNEVMRSLEKYLVLDSGLDYDLQSDHKTVWTDDGIAVMYRIEPFGAHGVTIRIVSNLPEDTPIEMAYGIVCDVIQQWGKLHDFTEKVYGDEEHKEPRKIVIPKMRQPRNVYIVGQALLAYEQWREDVVNDLRLPTLDYKTIDINALAKQMPLENIDYDFILAKLCALSLGLMKTKHSKIVGYDLRFELTK